MDKKTIVSFSFDDGRVDNINLAKNYLLPNNIPATFNITTGYIDGTASHCIEPCRIKPMTIDDVLWIREHPCFEIALHGDKHQNTPADIEKGRTKLCEWFNIPLETSFGFASPSSKLDLKTIEKNREYYESAVIEYIRSGDNLGGKSFKCAMRINNWIEKRIKHSDLFGRALNHFIDTLFFQKRISRMLNKDSMLSMAGESKFLHSITVYRGTSPEIIMDLIRYAIRHRQSLIMMMHSVSDDETDNDKYTYRKRDFIKLCEFLELQEKNNKLKMATVKDLYRMVRS